ncbi:MAG: chemotaxis-specific protein-glutamate methyltransferase CheB [Magnetococcales bacterium]|nr:chemotaxis-specific protein-glutamate methyltransferase CheB [Magnetococcales bacterium]
MISVLLVDDSPIAVLVLKKMLAGFPDIEVLGAASNGEEALEMIPRLRPQVICTDLHMPKMDGLRFTREVMRLHPLPILVISVSVHQTQDDHNIFELLDAGAIDVFPKPRGGLEGYSRELALELANKIRVLSGVIPIRRHQRVKPRDTLAPLSVVAPPSQPRPPRLVVIGASTGGPMALLTILSELPRDFPLPVVCIQHISKGFLEEMVSWLNGNISMPVRIAASGETLNAGHVYFPMEEAHLTFHPAGRCQIGSCGLEELHCPSIDVVFESAASAFREAVVGVLLTGMGRDGAHGMRAIVDAGGDTIAQDEASCVIFGMPAQAIALGGAREVLPLTRIASALLKRVGM